MDNSKTVWWMVAWGIVRHILTAIGAWLLSRGLIDADTHARLVSEGATQVVGWFLMLAPLIWSALQKGQAWSWIKTALQMETRGATTEGVRMNAPVLKTPI